MNPPVDGWFIECVKWKDLPRGILPRGILPRGILPSVSRVARVYSVVWWYRRDCKVHQTAG
jgi:hypothetical protein